MPEDHLATEVCGAPAAKNYIGYIEVLTYRTNKLSKSEERQALSLEGRKLNQKSDSSFYRLRPQPLLCWW